MSGLLLVCICAFIGGFGVVNCSNTLWKIPPLIKHGSPLREMRDEGQGRTMGLMAGGGGGI